MPTLTPTLPLLGRIRAGDQVPTKNGKTRPNRLDHFRLTSDNKPRLDYAQSLGWGAEVTEWAHAPEGRQWQLYCTMDTLTVVVPHVAAFSQYDEIWSGSECIYRCDGQYVIKAGPDIKTEDADDIFEGMPCACARFAERVPTVTRVSLYLPDLPGIGVWRLDTRGFYAGGELQGIVLMLQEAAGRGMHVEADLGITQRKVRRDGNTRVFPVPTLQPHEMTMGQMLQIRQAPQAVPQLPPPVVTNAEAFGDRDAIEAVPQHEALAAADPEALEQAERARILQSIKDARTDYGIDLREFIAWFDASPQSDGTPAGLASAPLETLRAVESHLHTYSEDTCLVPLGADARVLDYPLVGAEEAEDATWVEAATQPSLLDTEPDDATKRTEEVS